ncbi:MAG: nucleotide pyrophosphohydrolase [Phycisphaerae bacterium]
MGDAQTTVAELRQAVASFIDQRDWQQFHDPKNLAMSIAIEAAELMEHFQWVRSDQLQSVCDSAERRGQIAEELADVLCFVLSLANSLQIDLAAAVHAKLAKNAAKYPVARFRGRFS